MKKRMLAALLLSALLFTLSGCGEKSLLNKKEPVSLTFWHVYGEQAGSPMDLLVQEFNRETNTICSKSSYLELTNVALEMKNEIEKLREQVQNME